MRGNKCGTCRSYLAQPEYLTPGTRSKGFNCRKHRVMTSATSGPYPCWGAKDGTAKQEGML